VLDEAEAEVDSSSAVEDAVVLDVVSAAALVLIVGAAVERDVDWWV